MAVVDPMWQKWRNSNNNEENREETENVPDDGDDDSQFGCEVVALSKGFVCTMIMP